MIDVELPVSSEKAAASFSWGALWRLFDGDRDELNIAHECVDRHHPMATAARIFHVDGHNETVTFGELSAQSSRFASWLDRRGIRRGEAVGIMMDPSREFYCAIFGVLKHGAVAVPLYTLFGPDAVDDRLNDCDARLLVTDGTRERAGRLSQRPYVVFDEKLWEQLDQSESYQPHTRPDELAVLQYTSGTTRQMPEAVRHDHRSVVTLARAALYALGLRPGDRYFCPSSPAWGHGLWHGTIAPLSLGIGLGAYSGRFSAEHLLDALEELRITNLAAASTVYRMLLDTGDLPRAAWLEKASYTGEELDAEAQRVFEQETGISVRGMYGTTETGVILVNFPGFDDYEPRRGALGKPMPGCELTILDADATELAPNQLGEIAVRRRGDWYRSKDLGWTDDDGYFHYGGRADDVIISSGWTISPLEVERTLRSHPAVDDAAVVGVQDPTRGLIVKAFVVPTGGCIVDEALVRRLQDHVRERLSPHEYPRQVEFVERLPTTPNGKVDRRALRAISGG